MNLKKKIVIKIVFIVLAGIIVWAFIVSFPNPYIPVRNLIRYIRFPVDPSIIKLIETQIPDDPVEIEKFVLKNIKYKFDWENYDFPDYVPDARQVILKGTGDCEDRALVLASLLEAKNIKYSLRASIVHFWVDYPGKRPTKGENMDVSFFGKTDGRLKLKFPDMRQWLRYLKIGKEGIWDAMPLYRKIIMLSGWLIIIVLSFIWYRKFIKA